MSHSLSEAFALLSPELKSQAEEAKRYHAGLVSRSKQDLADKFLVSFESTLRSFAASAMLKDVLFQLCEFAQKTQSQLAVLQRLISELRLAKESERQSNPFCMHASEAVCEYCKRSTDKRITSLEEDLRIAVRKRRSEI